jgi:hypothetical protein
MAHGQTTPVVDECGLGVTTAFDLVGVVKRRSARTSVPCCVANNAFWPPQRSDSGPSASQMAPSANAPTRAVTRSPQRHQCEWDIVGFLRTEPHSPQPTRRHPDG